MTQFGNPNRRRLNIGNHYAFPRLSHQSCHQTKHPVNSMKSFSFFLFSSFLLKWQFLGAKPVKNTLANKEVRTIPAVNVWRAPDFSLSIMDDTIAACSVSFCIFIRKIDGFLFSSIRILINSERLYLYKHQRFAKIQNSGITSNSKSAKDILWHRFYTGGCKISTKISLPLVTEMKSICWVLGQKKEYYKWKLTPKLS